MRAMEFFILPVATVMLQDKAYTHSNRLINIGGEWREGGKLIG